MKGADSRGYPSRAGSGKLRLMRGLRLALSIGFGGILAIFVFAGIDSVSLLNEMRAKSRVLHDASLERSHRLDSIRSYVLLTQTYMGDYFTDSDEGTAQEHWAQCQETWSRMLTDLAGYQAGSMEEKALVVRLRELLDAHWRNVAVAARNRGSSRDEMFPLRTGVVEISTRVESVNAKQLAAAEAEIQREFEDMGHRLAVVLMIALGSALVLAAGCIVYILRIEHQNRKRYQEIERLSARLVAAQEEERRSISRELHDEIGQTLTAVIVDAANLANRIPQDDELGRKYLENIRNLADSSINSIRNIALLLRPSMLDDLGLIAALEWQAREVSRRTGIKVEVTDENVPESLPDAVRTCVYRVVQEALSNISSHSGAKKAVVTARKTGGTLVLTIEDDGSGFDPARTRGLGLLGMEERVKGLGGRMETQSAPGKGTTLRVTLPVTE